MSISQVVLHMKFENNEDADKEGELELPLPTGLLYEISLVMLSRC